MDRKYFLKKDYQALDKKIDYFNKELALVAHDIKISCEQSSETWHDNFDYEEGKRKQSLITNSLHELIHLKHNSFLWEQQNNLLLGKQIKILYLETQKIKEFFISSYVVLDEVYKNEISYNSPFVLSLGKIKKDDIKELDINNRKIKIKILDIF